jgi:hypothetical protein
MQKRHSAKTTSTNRTSTIRDNGAKDGKTPSKPVSLYPMDEEEALKRLLRVPPPDKGKKP